MRRARASRVGYLDLPHLPIQTARLRHPELRERPVIVVGDRVLDATADCYAAGVRVGVTAREAVELVPDAVFLPANPDADAEVVGRALDLLERFSEVVEETDGGAWFIPAGPLAGVTDERRLAASVGDGLAATLGLEARLAIAPGKHAARLIAEQSSEAIIVVPDGGVPTFLASWSIERLALGPSAIHRLRLLAVTTAGAFARLPPSGVPRRFGREAVLAHQIVRGEETTPLVPRRRPPALSLRHIFEPPIEDREMLLSAAWELLRRLGLVVSEGGKAFRTLGLGVGLEDGRLVERHADLRLPTADPRRGQPLLQAIVAALELDRAVAHVTLRLGEIGPEAPVQHQLLDDERFGGKRAERRERVNLALGEIARRYRGHVRRIVPGEDPHSLLDDYRLLLLPYEPDDARSGLPLGASQAEPAIRARPVHLLARGERLYLMDEKPADGGLPAFRDEIVALHARWEADDWWPTPARRTYYRVRTQRGTIATLARDHLRSGWLLVGNFD